MKNLIKSFVIILFLSLSFLSEAQVTVSVLTIPVSEITTTRLLTPLGVELKFANNMSFVAEYGIPIINVTNNEFKEKAYSLSVEGRLYKSALSKKNFKKYFAAKFNYRPESYSIKNNNYRTENDKTILFQNAEVSSTIYGFSLKWGLQKVYKNKFIFDFNIGLSLNNKTVTYGNVIENTDPYAQYNGSILNYEEFIFDINTTSEPYDGWPAFFPQPDDVAKSHTYVNIPMTIRVGYLFSRK